MSDAAAGAMTETPELVRGVQAGDPEALAAVARAYLGQLLRAARGAGLTAAQAEDVVQATFATFLETATRFEGRSRIRTWLFGILYRKISEARRGLQRDRRTDPIDEVAEARFRPDGHWARPPLPLDEALLAGEVRDHLDACLEDAPVRQRMAFVLREVEGLPTEEIRKILGVTRTNLGVLLFRARNRLRECLEARGVGRGGGGTPS